MPSTRISAPMRGLTLQLGRLSIRQHVPSVSARSSYSRSITTSPSTLASVSPITVSVDSPPSVLPLSERTVSATIHHFPSLEPLRYENFPANHLYLPTRRDILHRAVIYEGDKTRLGTASTKWRDEVRGSAKKLHPQKGTGRARVGDKKSPIRRGGGVAHGPKPRDFSTGLQKKVYDLAWRTALSYRFRKGELVIVDNALEIESPSPTLLRYIFERNRWGHRNGRSILVTLQERPLLSKALAESPKEGWTGTWEEVDVKDMLSLGRIVIERKALQNILLQHQSDIVHSTFPPKLYKKLEPEELQQNLGWEEFKTLEIAKPEDLPILQPELFERLAYKRLIQAKQYTGQDTAELQASAFNLLSEARRIQSEALERHPILREIESEDPEKAIQATEKRVELFKTQAERSEYMAKALRALGHEEAALEWEARAEEDRYEAAKDEVWLESERGTGETAETAEGDQAQIEEGKPREVR
ncbi:ribosomal protein L4 [Westerdykella ornata]|uniref:Large ribosomal subunit protein uL4m n=1 Tax=Westerdykella ornata TaxID=318751 RepID=A0A6A6JQ61_WESOR|nr:ribosomal protein L4 [Westerdykella ornata]KAF2278761.1 ribosomal protein L4 [Westerdykella ornata]